MTTRYTIVLILIIATIHQVFAQERQEITFYSLSENEMLPETYDDAYEYSEGLAAVKNEGKWGFINTKGRLVIPFEYEQGGSFKGGVVSVSKDGFYGVIDTLGQIVLDFEFPKIRPILLD